MEWQPIETAPKDGTWVLVYGAGTDDEDEVRKIAVAQYTNHLNGSTSDKWWWQFAWYDGGYYGRFDNPTHWAPLPEAPNARSEPTAPLLAQVGSTDGLCNGG